MSEFKERIEKLGAEISLGGMELRDEYQTEIHLDTIEHCRETNEPAFVEASVGAGKSLQIAFFADHVAKRNGKVLVLARQGELIEQNSNEGWAIGCKNSIYSASLKVKSLHYPVVFGTEGTIGRALHTHFKDWIPDCILVDECHMIDSKDIIRYFDAKKDGAIPALKSELARIDSTKSEKELKVAQSIRRSTPHLIYHKDTDKIYPETQYGRILVHFLMENPKVRIIGYTGSPYRGREEIIGRFWKRQLSSVDTMFLVSLGYLVPPAFGFGDEDNKYDLSEFQRCDEFGTEDYTKEELRAMQTKIVKDVDKTQSIIAEIVEKTQERNGVLITCAGQAHCKQVAEFLPEGTWAIVTDKTSTEERREILQKAKSGEIKYTIQIGCLTTGVNVPVWDTCVILRKIGSLTLLVQLIGRVLRTLKEEHIEAGFSKRDGLVLDYTDTLKEMGDIYDNPVLNKATVELVGKSKSHIICPACQGKNSPHAVQCIHEPDGVNRCEYFFKSTVCKNCETENAPSAEKCRGCGEFLRDPSQKLLNKAYSENEFKPVKAMTFSEDKNKNLWVKWEFDSTIFKDGIEKPEIGWLFFPLKSKKAVTRQMWKHFVLDHVTNKEKAEEAIKATANQVLELAQYFEVPVEATHRINDKDRSVILRKRFADGRVNFK